MFCYMFLESLIYGALLGLVVGTLTEVSLGAREILFSQSKINSLVLSLGAGIYEEFVFRFLLITGIFWILKKTLRNKFVIYTIAFFLSSLFFSLFHYLELFNEPFQVNSFLFRFTAGSVFAIIFIFRGYGIAAYSHSLYNILLMFR
ncbi:MAG: CPBP family intramembrane metalloprotease [Caldithrix sp.]|nr:MAG: CPBP family intramembrane metalloprotease [Caldithrix sp.]